MKIVVTDGYTLNPGDLSWDTIKELGEVIIYERTAYEAIVERCRDAAIILTNKVPIDRAILNQLPNLKLISVLATGYNVIDTKAAREKGIPVSNVPAYGTNSVAQHVFALLLELVNHVGLNAASAKNGEWQTAIDWCYSKKPLKELCDKTMGIVGFGNIGQQVARIGQAFKMDVLFMNPSQKYFDGASQVDVTTLFKESDFISLHCPLTENNFEFVNMEILAVMKRTAFLINTARGHLINEQHLAMALNENMLAGAALDVLSSEPPKESNPLLNAKNCIITPHTAWMSKEARQRILNATAENIKNFLMGQPANVVNAG